MGRYEPLRAFLDQQVGEQVRLSFAEVEAILGAALPKSKRYPAWWSNNPSNNPMTKVWLGAGFVTEQVDTARETVVFRRREAEATFRAAKPAAAPAAGWLDRLRDEFRGTVWIQPGYDLTQPTGEIWNAEQE